MHAWKEDLDFHELVLNDPAITGRVPRAKIEHAFDLKRQLKNIDKIFARVFPEEVAQDGRRRERAGKSSCRETAPNARSRCCTCNQPAISSALSDARVLVFLPATHQLQQLDQLLQLLLPHMLAAFRGRAFQRGASISRRSFRPAAVILP